jgi:hypothetical protein
LTKAELPRYLGAGKFIAPTATPSTLYERVIRLENYTQRWTKALAIDENGCLYVRVFDKTRLRLWDDQLSAFERVFTELEQRRKERNDLSVQAGAVFKDFLTYSRIQLDTRSLLVKCA